MRRIYLVAAAVVLVAGCATPPAPPKPPAALPKVLAKFERRLADGRLEVAANLKNATAAIEQGQVVCTFQDGDGKALPGPAPLAVTLEPGEVLTVHFAAATTSSAEAVVFVQP